MTRPTAFRVLSPRLLMRPYAETDAEARRELIDANDSHLRPWIPWMRDEPMSLEQTRELLRGHAARFRSRELFRYVIALADSGRMIGETGLYPRIGPGGLEAGYLIDRLHCDRGYAAEATAAMLRVAFEVEDVERVELHCAPGNVASNRIPPRFGFVQQSVRVPEEEPGKSGTLNVWTLRADRYPGSAAATLAVQAWTEDGQRLL